MSCPKKSIELRRDMLNLLHKNPKLATNKMKICSDLKAKSLLKDLEDKGIIDVDTSSRTHIRTLTDKGIKYMNAYNAFSDFTDIL